LHGLLPRQETVRSNFIFDTLVATPGFFFFVSLFFSPKPTDLTEGCAASQHTQTFFVTQLFLQTQTKKQNSNRIQLFFPDNQPVDRLNRPTKNARCAAAVRV